MKCPLCDKELKYSERDRIYSCDTIWRLQNELVNSFYPHYTMYSGIVDIFIDKYRLLFVENLYSIYTLSNGSNWKLVLKLPPFPIHSAEQLAHKIKLLLVFS